jgi:hypothetical protein
VADWFDDSTRGALAPTPKPLTFLGPNLRIRVAGRTPAGPVVAVDLDSAAGPSVRDLLRPFTLQPAVGHRSSPPGSGYAG